MRREWLQQKFDKLMRKSVLDTSHGYVVPPRSSIVTALTFEIERTRRQLALFASPPPAASAKPDRVSVPRIPTEEMLSAGDSAIPRFEPEPNGIRIMGREGALACWQAMIAASEGEGE